MEIIYKGICHLGEGPVWNAQQKKLYWTDIFERRIWVYEPEINTSRIFWQSEHRIGGYAFTKKGDIVLCSDKGVFILSVNMDGNPKAEPQLLFQIPLDRQKNEMFNDITVDPAGRIFAGTLVRDNFTEGTLYRLEKGKDPVIALRGIYCSNGMTFSLDEEYFYHTDSGLKRITRYEYDRSTGTISSPEVYFQGTEATGSPDGITLDSKNHVWAAFWGGACVRRIAPDGKVVAEQTLPAKQISSVMFGGDELDQLYVTSAAEGAGNLETGCSTDGVFLGGQLYRLNPGVKGREEWLADF